MIAEILLAAHLTGGSWNIYDSKGNRTGEIREKNGRFEIYNPDGSRQGYGKPSPASPSTIDAYKPDGTGDQTIQKGRTK